MEIKIISNNQEVLLGNSITIQFEEKNKAMEISNVKEWFTDLLLTDEYVLKAVLGYFGHTNLNTK
jgi:hypothetical protein